MTFKTLLSALARLAIRAVSLVFKLCGVFLTLCFQAFIAGASESGDSDERAAQHDSDNYYASAAEYNFKDGWGS